MARNESVARLVMLVCFGTAFLSLAVHWQVRKTTEQLNSSVSTAEGKTYTTRSYSQNNRPARVVRDSSPVTIGEPALGASLPPARRKSARNSADAVWPASNPSLAKNKDASQSTRLTSGATEQPKLPFFPSWGQSKADAKAGSAQTEVVVNLSDRRVYVYRYGEVIASYPVAVGKKGWETPTGSFQVMHMEHHPIWKHPITGEIFEPGTDSPLGDRWIGFWSDGRNEIGFHGTPDVDLVGTAISHGCLRMRNSDVRMLYSQVSLGTPVVVEN
jgi:lipoprotein-anchoring transpeptidase ErfK/SrfK